MTVMLVFVLEFVESFVFCWRVVQQLRGQDKGSRWSKKPIIVHVQALWLGLNYYTPKIVTKVVG